jgi:hypothetical protein
MKPLITQTKNDILLHVYPCYNNTYDIPKSELKTPEGKEDWYSHLREKVWWDKLCNNGLYEIIESI